MGFEIKNVSTVEIIDSKINDRIIDKSFILKLSNNSKSWKQKKYAKFPTLYSYYK